MATNTAIDDIKDEYDKWKRFNEWIHCICIVTFDLELGQAMELVYPSHIKLTEQEKTNICYLAFPDSNSGCMGDTQYHIRLRVSPGTKETTLNLQQLKFNTECVLVQKADAGHYWGFVYFRQTKDITLPRGYFQKSFIILTRLPFFNLFYEICSIMAPKYFADGLNTLNTCCKQICKWPELKAGETITLNILDTAYQTIIPKSNSRTHNINNITESTSSSTARNDDDLKETTIEEKTDNNDLNNFNIGPKLPPQVLISLHEIDIFRSLGNFINNIHLLWELVLIGEPIVIMGTSPSDSSHMIQSLISLISPLLYFGESRPYFTIHDSEFKEFTQQQQDDTKFSSIMIGVTNPFFIKPLQNWPHILRLMEPQQLQQSQSYRISSTQFGINLNNSTNNFNINNTLSSSSLGNGATKLRKLKQLNTKLLDYSPGIYTKYKPYLHKDKTIIKKIMHGVKTKRPQQVQSALLRRYLLELTQSFMIPLERYLASLMPLQKDISPFKAPPMLSQFKQDVFLSTLEQSGPQLTTTLKGDWAGLYKRFFQSTNFKGWYEQREMELRQTLQALQLQALSDADLNKWAQGKHEVEIVDMILKLKQKLKLYTNPYETNQQQNVSNSETINNSQAQQQQNDENIINQLLKTSTRNQLLKHIENMKQTLPDDLKIILNDT